MVHIDKQTSVDTDFQTAYIQQRNQSGKKHLHHQKLQTNTTTNQWQNWVHHHDANFRDDCLHFPLSLHCELFTVSEQSKGKRLSSAPLYTRDSQPGCK